MVKKYLVLTLIALVLNLSLSGAAFAANSGEKEQKFIEKVKANIAKLGTGREARVEVKLIDGTKLKGYVDQISETSFVVMNEKTAAAVEVPYAKTKQVRGNNLNTGVKIAIGAAIIIAIALALYFGGVLKEN